VLTNLFHNAPRGTPFRACNGEQILKKQTGTIFGLLRKGAQLSSSLCLRVVSTACVLTVCAAAGAHAEDRALKLYNIHTKERATIVFKRNGQYDRAGLAKMNQFLRDWRRNEPTKIDPKLLDLVWTAYQQTGSNNYIHVVSSYRSPATNGSLRKRSSGVAKNSQHMQGKAMDFFIPGYPLDKLRAIGLRMQVGGVGYYPTSGAPFVHFDTGSVRHWPRMTRQQLVKVFPKGDTIHIPTDGKPLPGYAKALASYKARGQVGALTLAASRLDSSSSRRRSVGEPVVVASAESEVEDDEIESKIETAAAAPPVPRFSPVPYYRAPEQIPVPVPAPQVQMAFAQPATGELTLPDDLPTAGPIVGNSPVGADPIGDLALRELAPRPAEFDTPSHWNTPSVPGELAEAMATRDVSRPASLPIQPTAVVATVDVPRSIRADAMTAAVMQDGRREIRDVTPVLAYAGPMQVTSIPPSPRPEAPRADNSRPMKTVIIDGVPVPVANPLLAVASAPSIPAPAPIAVAAPAPRHMVSEELTLTALDTLALRQWIGSQSTRQKSYALLSMPDFAGTPSLLKKPDIAYRSRFGDFSSQTLRTDRFSGSVAQQPPLVDLTARARLALR